MSLKQLLRNIIVSVPKNKNKIIFESHSDFTDSSKALYDQLKDNRKYKFIWYVDHIENFVDTKNTKFIDINKKKSLRSLYHILTSKYIFFTHRSFPLQNYKTQYIVNLTHGIGAKKSKGKLDNNFNYLICTNIDTLKNILISEFENDSTIMIESGYPRNDLLFKKNKNVEKFVKGYDKVVLWLPTFRKHKNGAVDTVMFDNQTFPLFKDDELEELNNKLVKMNYLLILKLHPAQFITNKKVLKYSNVRVITNDDLEQLNIEFYYLLGRADTVLTDYSSVGNDFLLLDRPIGYVIADFDEYSSSRGFCIEPVKDYLPGMKIYNKEEFYAFLDDFKAGTDKYKKDRKRVRDFYWKYQDDKNCKRIIDYFNL